MADNSDLKIVFGAMTFGKPSKFSNFLQKVQLNVQERKLIFIQTPLVLAYMISQMQLKYSTSFNVMATMRLTQLESTATGHPRRSLHL